PGGGRAAGRRRRGRRCWDVPAQRRRSRRRRDRRRARGMREHPETSTGPVPPGTPPTAATPDGGPTAAGPSPTGHPSPSRTSEEEGLAQAEAAVEQDIDIARIARERDDYL